MWACARTIAAIALFGFPNQAVVGENAIGAFEHWGDVGAVALAGAARFDPASQTYMLTGGGANLWGKEDAFHFVWQKCWSADDRALAADIAWPTAGGQPHRKACLLFRQSLDPAAAYVDVAVHGDGLTSLQFRLEKGGATHEIQANLVAPVRVQLVKRGKYALLYCGQRGAPLAYTGAAVPFVLAPPFYVGLGVCAHDNATLATATFRNVESSSTSHPAETQGVLYSALEVQSIRSTDRRVVLVVPRRIEAPNWTRDGQSLLYNSGGRMFRIAATGGEPVTVETGFAVRCNNDHGLSPDGRLLAISDQSQGDRKSRIYTLPAAGGTPRLVTPLGPSYWHGWSPDGKTLAYCAERNGDYDVYTIPVAGGAEHRLTTAKGLDDGPEFSPDGKSIYFNSDRTGTMQIWRMHCDGSAQTPVTSDAFNNWFPHPSPDGRSLVFLSYAASVQGHPADKDVALRRLHLQSGAIDVLARFVGGQGTINVPCWSPDGSRIAFVTYQWVH